MTLTPKTGAAEAVALSIAHLSPHTISIVIPSTLPVDAYQIAVTARPGVAANITANTPAVWWVQGDAGETATPGGWLRAFGNSLSLMQPLGRPPRGKVPPPGEMSLGARMQATAKRIEAAARRGDWAAVAELGQAATSAANVASTHPSFAIRDALSTTLTLIPVTCGDHLCGDDFDGSRSRTEPIVLMASSSNLSAYSASFAIPTSVPPGVYSVSLSNGAATAGLDSYHNHTHPHVHTVEIRAAAAGAWSNKTFSVVDAGCSASLTNTSTQINCTDAVQSAIASAAAAGGGVVAFGPGRFYVDPPLLLPDGVRLVGAGMGKSALYFRNLNRTNPDPPLALIANAGPGRFGVEDLDLYTLAFYVAVIQVWPFHHFPRDP